MESRRLTCSISPLFGRQSLKISLELCIIHTQKYSSNRRLHFSRNIFFDLNDSNLRSITKIFESRNTINLLIDLCSSCFFERTKVSCINLV